jgi:hypothetical protein
VNQLPYLLPWVRVALLIRSIRTTTFDEATWRVSRDLRRATAPHFASHYVMRGGSIVKLQDGSVRTTQIYARLAPDDLIGATAIPEGLGASGNSASVAHGVLSEQASLAARG